MNNLKSKLQRLAIKISHMSFTLPIGSLKYRVVECPGLWATDAYLKKLTNDLVEVARNCQGEKEIPLYGVLKGEREDLSKRLITIAYNRKTGKPVGFSAQIYLDLKDYAFSQRVLHLGLIYVDKTAQGKNVSYLLAVFPNILILLKNIFRDIWVSNVSQVPAVCGLVAQNYYNVYPNVDGTRQTFHHRKIGELIFENHKSAFGVGEDASYDSKRQVISNAYTGGSDNLKKSFNDSPKHRDPRINKMCSDELNYERGDDFLQLGVLSAKAISDLYKKKTKGLQGLNYNILFDCYYSMGGFYSSHSLGLRKTKKRKN